MAKPIISSKPIERPKAGALQRRPNPPNTEFRRFYERGDLPMSIEHRCVCMCARACVCLCVCVCVCISLLCVRARATSTRNSPVCQIGIVKIASIL